MSSDDSDVRLTSSVINRRWVDIVTSRADDGDDDDDDLRLRVATYNILSDNYVRDDRYLYCPAQLRYMSSRHERIIAEINNMQPHVVCLQVSLSLSLSLILIPSVFFILQRSFSRTLTRRFFVRFAVVRF